jgi:WD40 repeat protein
LDGKWNDGDPAVAFSPDDAHLLVGRVSASGYFQNEIQLHEVPSMENVGSMSLKVAVEKQLLRREDTPISPDGKSSAVRTNKGVFLRDRTTEKLSPLLSTGKNVLCTSCAFHPDGKTIFAGCDTGFQQWDVATNKLVRMLPHRYVVAIHFSPDGQRMATLSRMGGQDPVCLWDLATGERICKEFQPKGGVEQIAFSPDWRWVLLILNDFGARKVEWRSTTTGATPGWDQSLPRAVRRILDRENRPYFPQQGKEWMLVSADCKNILAVTQYEARLWEVLPPEGPRLNPPPPFPVNGKLDEIRSWVEAFTGMGSPPLEQFSPFGMTTQLGRGPFEGYPYWLDQESWASRRRQWTKNG